MSGWGVEVASGCSEPDGKLAVTPRASPCMRCHETCSANTGGSGLQAHREQPRAGVAAAGGAGGLARRVALCQGSTWEKNRLTRVSGQPWGHVGGVAVDGGTSLLQGGGSILRPSVGGRRPAAGCYFLPHSCSIRRPLSSAVLSPQPRLAKSGCCWPGAGSVESGMRHGGHGRCCTDLNFLRVRHRSSLTWQGRRPVRMLCACPRPPVPKGCPWPPMPSSCFWPAPLAWPAGQKHSFPSIS